MTWGFAQGSLFTLNDMEKVAFWNNAAKMSELCYTQLALNTSVVLCGPSGAVPDLRLPASSFLRKSYA